MRHPIKGETCCQLASTAVRFEGAQWLAARGAAEGADDDAEQPVSFIRRAPRARNVTTGSAVPSAAEITVAETLALLDGDHAAVAREVANGRYVFWLGSGISRGRVDGLPGVVERVLEFLRERAALEGAGGPH